MRPGWIALAAWIFCVAGFVGIRLYVGRRRFYRTNAAGVEEFESYGRAVASWLFEAFLHLLTLVLLLSGLIPMAMLIRSPPGFW